MWRLLPVRDPLRNRSGLRCFSNSALEWLAGFTNFESKGVPARAGKDSPDGFDLGRMRRLLSRLGDPQRHWSAVHVAGTKGKGSTTALMSSMLSHADYTVGTYISPHVASFTERISINTTPIDVADLGDLVGRHRQTIEGCQREEGGALTHFEVVTALAFKHFQEQEVDMAVVEVGLGGARDATNVLDDSLRVAVVTSIGTDHRDALGDSIEEIAAAKAGILRQGRPVVIARQPYPGAERVVRERAALLGCPVVSAPHEVGFQQWGPEFVPGEGFRDGSEMQLEGATVAGLLAPFQPSTWDVTMRLLGPHQGDNAAAAVAAAALLKSQGFHRINLQCVIDGLATARLLGRFQVCRFAPGPAEAGEEAAGKAPEPAPLSAPGSQGLSCALPSPQQPWVVLDGAHTAESSQALADTVREMFPHNPLALVVAMAGDKEHMQFLAQLRAAHPAVVVFTEVEIAGGRARAAAPGALAAAWQAAGLQVAPPPRPGAPRTRVLIQASLAAAVEKARAELSAFPGTGVLCVTGSMHAVGAALRQLDLEQL